MLRALRLIFLGVVGVVLLTVALANREPVVLRLLPDAATAFLGVTWAVRLPLFLIIFGGVLAGLAVGLVWEWFREARLRADAAQKARDLSRLQREVGRMRDKTQGDDVLALIDQSGKGA